MQRDLASIAVSGLDCVYADACYVWFPSAHTCSFSDPLPAGARLRSLAVTRPLSAWEQTPPSVVFDLNGVRLGPAQSITNYAATCEAHVRQPYTFPSESYQDGMPGYAYGGANHLVMTNTGAINPGQTTVEFRYTLPVDVVAVSGSQVGVISHPAEARLVARLTAPSGVSLVARDVTFEFESQPPRAGGAAIGASAEARSARSVSSQPFWP